MRSWCYTKGWLFLFLVWVGLSAEGQTRTLFEFSVTEYGDNEYPDNPDIGFRAADYQTSFFQSGTLVQRGKVQHDLIFITHDGDSISLNNLDLHSWVPTVPQHLRSDNYLTELALVNQEWNRNQVRFGPGDFTSTKHRIVCVDVARNCLQAYLWEVAVYVEEQGKVLPYAHAWFDFPNSAYDALFRDNNGHDMDVYRHCLANWVDPESKPIDRDRLRTVVEEIPVTFTDASDHPYALAGERAKKRKEIMHPAEFATMRDLQTDSTTFATFSPPGNYRRADPRKTELGRIRRLKAVNVFRTDTEGIGTALYEIEMIFSDQKGGRHTNFILGGLDLSKLPVRSVEEAHTGWQSSMGFGNHTFYESYATHKAWSPKMSPYYAYLCDEAGSWLDSHAIGIDGPLLHRDINDPSTLHIWLLSFERHALVGHYIVSLP